MKKMNAVIIRIFQRCPRCGKEEESEEVTRMLEQPIIVDEKNRITIEALFDNTVEEA